MIDNELIEFLSYRDLERLTGLSESTILRMERRKTFPQRAKIKSKKAIWLKKDVTQWMKLSSSENQSLPALETKKTTEEENFEDYLNSIEDPCNKADNLVALIDRCKLLAAKYESSAAEYRQSAELWEHRFQKLQGFGVRLLKESPMHSVESKKHILGLDRTMPEVKAAVCRTFHTDWMIPDEFKFSIPESYREPKLIWVMRIDDVKNALLSGKKLNFARLVDKQRLRILNKTEEQYERRNDPI